MPKPKVEIIYNDNDLLVVNKPSGISVTKDRGGSDQLIDLLAVQLGDEVVSSLRLIHRLDKATSGLLVLAKNLETQSAYSSSFEKRLVKKTYLALVIGFVPKPQGKINARIIKDSKRPGQVHLTRKRGKDASTNWRLLADFNSAALLAVSPITGRTHQIRVHLPSIGLPLAIDPLYGSQKPLFLSDFKPRYNLPKGKEEKPLIDRLTLHAYQLEFTYPLKDKPKFFIAPLDKKFKATIKMYAKHNPKGINAFSNAGEFDNIINSKKLE